MLRIVIPARMGSTRLPDKMIQRIGRKMLVEHALDRVEEAVGREGLREVYLASDSDVICGVAANRCNAVRTSANARTGTDRVAEAADIVGFDDDDIVVNVQADMPFLNPGHLGAFLLAALKPGNWDMLTAYCDHRVVQVRVDGFERAAVPCHVGVYAFKRPALRRFAALETSPLEAAIKLEQIRAVENGFKIDFHVVPEMPFEVNTPQDLAAAQHLAECLA